MIEDEERPAAVAANDNVAAWARIDKVVLTPARLIGRQMAHDAFERLNAANDNHPPDTGQD